MPLSHIKVIDLTRARSGPTCVRQLSEMGAQVITIETPGSDETMVGRHHYDFQNLHPNKRSLTLNLKDDEARAILIKLVQQSDVIVENFRPEVKHRLGLDHATLSKVNPRLVYGSISGFGQTGPDRDRPGLDQIAQGMSGVMTVNGEVGGGPLRVGLPIADLTAGFMAAYGIVVALLERERSGRGQWVHTSLLQAMIRLMDFQSARYLVAGEVPGPVGNNHPIMAPANVYRCRNGSIIIQVAGQTLYERFCNALGAPQLLSDPRFREVSGRFAHRADLDQEIQRVLSTHDASYWIDLFTRLGVPAGQIFNVQECFDNAQVQTLPVTAKVQHPHLGPQVLLGSGVNLERTPPRITRAAPDLGEHTHEILGELGYSLREIAALQQRGAA